MEVSVRGRWLENAKNLQENSNLRYGKSVVIGQDSSGDDIKAKIGDRCPKCKFRIRGLNHQNGSHHRNKK